MPDDTAVAYHEAGHCIVALALGCTVRHVEITPSPHSCYANKNNMRIAAHDRVAIALAGDIAQVWACPDSRRGAKRDNQIALDAACLITVAPRNYLHHAQRRAASILDRHWQHVETLVAALLARGKLNGEEVLALVRAK
jgi:ATP-dependent Zn protease